MTLKIAQFLNTMLFALVMGVFWGTWFTLSRSIEGFQPQTFLDIGQTAIRNLVVPMAILMPPSRLSALMMIALLPKMPVWLFANGFAGRLADSPYFVKYKEVDLPWRMVL